MTLPAPNGLRKRALWVPAKLGYAVPNESLGQSGKTGPLGHGVTFATEVQDMVAPLVVGLNGRRRPAAIGHHVGTIVVDSVYGVAGRTGAHVAQKRLEALQPFLAHGDAAPTIVRELGVLGVGATLFSMSPGVVFTAHGAPVRSQFGSRDLSSQASTASSKTRAQTRRYHHGFLAAITDASPCRMGRTPLRHESNSGQASITQPGQVQYWHVRSYNSANVVMGPQERH